MPGSIDIERRGEHGELPGYATSASSISAVNKRRDASLTAFANHPFQEPFHCIILEARYEKLHKAGVQTGQAILIAVGIEWDGR